MGGRIINMEVNSICLESVTSLRLWSFVCADVYWGHPFSGNGGGVGCAQTRSGTLTTRESNSDVPVQGILGAAFESREERVGCNCALYSPLLSCCCGWSSWGPGGLGMFQVSLPAFVALAWRAMWARQVCMLGRRLSQAGLGHQGWVTSPPRTSSGEATWSFLPATACPLPTHPRPSILGSSVVAPAPPTPSLTGLQTLCTNVQNGAEQTRGFLSWKPHGQVTSSGPPPCSGAGDWRCAAGVAWPGADAPEGEMEEKDSTR